MALPQNQTSNMRLSQMKNILNHKNTNADHIRLILQTGYDINCIIASTQHLELKQPKLIGCTALHLAFMEDRIEAFKLLLDEGADYTIKNRDGLTVLHQVLEKSYNNESMLRLESEFASSILSKHSENLTNSCTNYGLSHFHAACLCNNAELVRLFLENGVSADDSVEINSSIFSGYSPLHFAVRSYGLETVQVLLEKGVNQHLENSEGKTPLHMLVEQKIKILNSAGVDTLKTVLEDHEKILHLLYQCKNRELVSFSDFHLACTMKDSSLLKSILKSGVNIDFAIDQNSLLWPGFTGPHFAALCNFENLILLLENGANIEVKNTAGLTVFDLCLNKYEAEHIHQILSSVNIWKDIVLSDNETTLVDLVEAMQTSEQLEAFFESSAARATAVIPTDSVLWPGFTVLHVAVRLFITDPGIVNACLKAGADVTAQSANDSTALHLAFRREEKDLVDLLLRQHHQQQVNCTDDENLSILHIACARPGQEEFVRSLLQTEIDVNVAYKGKPIGEFVRTGFTPLHVAVVAGNDKLVRQLLAHGADRYAPDSQGFTPIHWVLAAPDTDNVEAELFVSLEDVRECIVSGLSHLHVVCYVKNFQFLDNDNYVDNCELVKKFLAMPDAKIDAAVIYNEKSSPSFLSKLAGTTPLWLSVLKKNWWIAQELARSASDVLAGRPNGSTLFYDALAKHGDRMYFMISILKADDEARRRVEEETGLTMLHLACCTAITGEDIELALNNGGNMDAQIHADSPVWPGYTPLHVLLKYTADSWYLADRLKHNFDTTLQNADGDTAVHLAYKNKREKWLTKLLDDHLNYNVNPIDADGLSHFHIACSVKRFDVVERFLRTQIIDVNRSTDAFSELNGQSSLHLALNGTRFFGESDEVYNNGCLRTFELLVKGGANVNAEDALGETPLHKFFSRGINNLDIFYDVVEAGADVQAINIIGISALRILLSNEDFLPEYLQTFVKHGCRLNAFSPGDKKGYVSLIFCNDSDGESKEKRILFDAMLRYRRTTDTDEEGRTVIHNLVSNSATSLAGEEYAELIDQLLTITRCRCDVDDQDAKGRTPLHYAADFDNEYAIAGLLMAGADINVSDNEGHSALYYLARKEEPEDEEFIMADHVKRLECLQLYVSQENKDIADEIYQRQDRNIASLHRRIESDLELARDRETGFPSLTLYHFLSEPNSRTIRAVMGNQTFFEDFFRDLDDDDFEELFFVFKLQYRKTVARGKLIEQASAALDRLSRCTLLCAELVVRFCADDDLKNLIEARRMIGD